MEDRMRSRSKSRAADRVDRSSRGALFDQPPLLPGEDAGDYDALVELICLAVKPADVIEEMLTTDIATLEWEVLRWRRLKSSLVQARARKALEEFLNEQLGDKRELYLRHFTDCIAESLQGHLPRDQARMLAHKWAVDELEATVNVKTALGLIELRIGDIMEDARGRKAKELAEQYIQRKPAAVAQVEEFLSGAGISIHNLTIDALDYSAPIERIERIDRLAAIAENRRNAALHEIERHRAVFGEMLRRALQDNEDSHLRLIETTPSTKQDAEQRAKDQGESR
jgi:hypothetical protein